MTLDYEITSARLRDVPFLRSIEKAAATLLKDTHMILSLRKQQPKPSSKTPRRMAGSGLPGRTVFRRGFAHADIREPTVACLKELDVHPEHARRGLVQTPGHGGLPVCDSQVLPIPYA